MSPNRMAEPILEDELMNKIGETALKIEGLIKEHGENSLFVKAEKLRLGTLRRRLEYAQELRKEAELEELVKQREIEESAEEQRKEAELEKGMRQLQIENEIREREDRIGRACGMCEKLKQELEDYKMEMGVAASSPERNARIQAARAEKAMRNEENARNERELKEALAKQSAEYEAEVAAAVAKLQANEGAASAAAASAAAASAAAAPKKSLFGSLFGKKGGRRRTIRRRIARSKKTRRNYRR